MNHMHKIIFCRITMDNAVWFDSIADRVKCMGAAQQIHNISLLHGISYVPYRLFSMMSNLKWLWIDTPRDLSESFHTDSDYSSSYTCDHESDADADAYDDELDELELPDDVDDVNDSATVNDFIYALNETSMRSIERIELCFGGNDFRSDGCRLHYMIRPDIICGSSSNGNTITNKRSLYPTAFAHNSAAGELARRLINEWMLFDCDRSRTTFERESY